MTTARVNIGLRYVLPVYPFVFVLASRLATVRFRRAWVSTSAVAVLIAMTAFSSLRAAPHYLAYFNGLIGGPSQGLNYLSDSNIDWGQDLKGLKAYMQREHLPMIYLSYFCDASPEYYGVRYQYVPSYGPVRPPPPDVLPDNAQRQILAISVFNLQGVCFRNKGIYRWLLSRTPVARIGHSVHVYDLTDDAEAHLRLAEIYLDEGPHELAAAELRKVLSVEPSNSRARELLESLPSNDSPGRRHVSPDKRTD